MHRRTDGGGWITQVAITGGRVTVSSSSCDLAVDEVYRSSRIGAP